MLSIVAFAHSWRPLGGGMVFQQEKAFTVWDLSTKIKWPCWISFNCSLLLIPQCLFLISLTLCFSHWSFELCSSQLTRVPSVSGPQWTSHAAFALHLWQLFHTVSLWTWRKLTRTFSVRYFAPDISTMGMGWSFQHAVACEECRLQDRPCCMAGLPAWRRQTVRKAGLQHEHLLREGWTGTQRHPSLMNELVKAAPLLTHNLHERFRTPF